MNEQLQAALAEILSRATQGIDAGTQFLSAQLPDVIQQLLMWKMVAHLIPMIASAFLVLISATVAWRLYVFAMKDPRIAAEMQARRHDDAYFRSAVGSPEEKEAKEAKKAAQRLANSLPDKTFFYVVSGILTGATLFVSALCFLSSLNLTWLQIWIAPKIYLIEYAASLAK